MRITKKILQNLILIAGLTVLFTEVTLAASSIILSPGSISPKAGDIVKITVSINPNGINNSTVKLELKYPADLLEVQSFAFGDGWMPLTQSGYDLIDNANGVLLKTAGYPNGFSVVTVLGTATLKAKKTGNGLIKVGSNSMALDVSSVNVLTDISASVAIAAPAQVAVAPKPLTTPKPIVALTSPQAPPAATSSATPTISEEPTPIQTENASTIAVQQASILDSVSEAIKFGKFWWAWLVFLLAVIYIIYRLTKKKSGLNI